jgi:hypothetical protein
MPRETEPFNNKYRLECECAACNSKYKIIYFEDDVSGPMMACPFCMEQADEFSETNEFVAEENKTEGESILYTDDEEATFENKIVDDDEYNNDDDEDGEK